MGGQTQGDPVGGRVPPGETALRKARVAEPEPLAVVHEHLQRRPAAVAEDEDGTGEGVLPEGLLAQPRQANDAAVEIGRLDGDEDFHLRRDLQHHSALTRWRARAATSTAS
jgi:hypothetical protein